MSAWDLIKSGQFHEAADRFTEELAHRQSGPAYCNRGTAYLNLGEYEKAIADFQAANDLSEHTSDGYLQRTGAAHWLAGRESVAAALWLDLVHLTERGKIQYTDAAGGVESALLLWFAAIRLNNIEFLKNALRLLEKKTAAKGVRNWNIENWPGPLGKFVIGKLDEASLRKAISDVPVLRERQLCQVEFYIAVRALQSEDTKGAQAAFRRASELSAAVLEEEYYLAKHELQRVV